MFGRAILGILCAIGLGAEASAAALLEETLRNGHVVLHLTGRIDSRDAALFDAAVGKLTEVGKRIDVVSLNSTGGQLGEGADCGGHQSLAAGDPGRGWRGVCVGLLPAVRRRRATNGASKFFHRRPQGSRQ